MGGKRGGEEGGGEEGGGKRGGGRGGGEHWPETFLVHHAFQLSSQRYAGELSSYIFAIFRFRKSSRVKHTF